MRIFLSLFMVVALASCTAMREANYKNIFTIAYGQEAEKTGDDTYRVSFSFIVFPSANIAEERKSLFTGLHGALARAGKSHGYTAMTTRECEGQRRRAGGSYLIQGACTAIMYQVPPEDASSILMLDDALEKAEKRRATLERI